MPEPLDVPASLLLRLSIIFANQRQRRLVAEHLVVTHQTLVWSLTERNTRRALGMPWDEELLLIELLDQFSLLCLSRCLHQEIFQSHHDWPPGWLLTLHRDGRVQFGVVEDPFLWEDRWKKSDGTVS